MLSTNTLKILRHLKTENHFGRTPRSYEIASRLGVPLPSVSASLANLTRTGAVTATGSPRRYTITPAGEAHFDKLPSARHVSARVPPASQSSGGAAQLEVLEGRVAHLEALVGKLRTQLDATARAAALMAD